MYDIIKMHKIGITLLNLALIQLTYTEGTQSNIATKCSLSDSPCLTTQAQSTLHTLVDGIPELGIQKLDKLPVDDVRNIADNFLFNWTDVTVGGLRNAVIDNVRVNMELKTLRILFHTTLDMQFDYVLDGMLLSVLPVSGTGKGELILDKMQMELLFIFDIVKDDNGKDIMDLKKSYYGYNIVGGGRAHFENVYNGDKKKSEMFHNLVNESWRVMAANFAQSFQGKITKTLFEAIKIYMRSHPLEEIALY